MAENFLYLTTIGRTSGAERQIEIWFVEREAAHYVVSEMRERAGWVKNLLKQPQVAFSVGTRTRPGAAHATTPATARIVRDEEEPLVGAVKALMDAKYGWSDGLVVELRPDHT
jgi:deazaflavin-dependent oxidoreductase (nitroreductase family)